MGSAATATQEKPGLGSESSRGRGAVRPASPPGGPSGEPNRAAGERDSNPRAPFGANGFQDRRLKPLGHLLRVRERLFGSPAAAEAAGPSATPEFRLITDAPSMNGRSASGITTEPSAC